MNEEQALIERHRIGGRDAEEVINNLSGGGGGGGGGDTWFTGYVADSTTNTVDQPGIAWALLDDVWNGAPLGFEINEDMFNPATPRALGDINNGGLLPAGLYAAYLDLIITNDHGFPTVAVLRPQSVYPGNWGPSMFEYRTPEIAASGGDEAVRWGFTFYSPGDDPFIIQAGPPVDNAFEFAGTLLLAKIA